MEGSVISYYQGLSVDYHLLFENWSETVVAEGRVLDRLLRDALGDQTHSVLDCCCGIGTQAIGLALRGHRVRGTDLTGAAVERAAREAAAFKTSIMFSVADVRRLSEHVEGVFDAVLACDNALPHLLTDDDLHQGLCAMASRLRRDGLFLASTRDYDVLVRERPAMTPAEILTGPPGRRIIFQVWDWHPDSRGYRVQQFIAKDTGTGWQMVCHAAEYRALLRADFTDALRLAGLTDVQWHAPERSGYHQPIVTARKP